MWSFPAESYFNIEISTKNQAKVKVNWILKYEHKGMIKIVITKLSKSR